MRVDERRLAAGTRQINRHDLLQPSWIGRHYCDTVRQQHRLPDVMGDEHDGLAQRSSQMRSNSMFMNSRDISSSAENGSSISEHGGSHSSMRQIATRCCMPPESSNG